MTSKREMLFVTHARKFHGATAVGDLGTYDPFTATWLSAESYRGTLTNPQSQHRYGYGYVEGNPTTHTATISGSRFLTTTPTGQCNIFEQRAGFEEGGYKKCVDQTVAPGPAVRSLV